MIPKKDKSIQLKLNNFTNIRPATIKCELCGEWVAKELSFKLDDLDICEFCNDKEMYKNG